jgi:hypothetical protein
MAENATRWAVYFDGEAGKITATRDVFPIERCRFSPDGLDVNIAGATLSNGVLAGSASGPDGCIVWDLQFEGGQEPLTLHTWCRAAFEILTDMK